MSSKLLDFVKIILSYEGHVSDPSFKDIYLVQTKASQKNIPRSWTKSGGTKVSPELLSPSMKS